ncbi:MAG: lytic transglycosylase domain-containing protein, partial [Pseudomonadota bacterium]
MQRALYGPLFLILGGCASTASVGRPLSLPDRVQTVLPFAEQAANRHGVSLNLVLGLIHVESRFQTSARSSVGARGLTQLMPNTAKALAEQLGWNDYEIDDPAFNIEAGTFYLAILLRRFDGNVSLALAAYNAGPARVSRWVENGSELPEYSKKYVNAVLAAREQFQNSQFPTDKSMEKLRHFQHATDLDQDALRNLLLEHLKEADFSE